MNQLLRFLRAASPAPASAEAPDRELLARFARARDASAFAALVSRHGAAVWAACRRLLDREQDAEDAFQAVFLTLARKASSVSGEVLPAWLHGVARRVAANVRRDERRRNATEDAARVPEGRAANVSWREGLAILDEELAKLPDRYRTVLIVCCLDGRTRDEAARQLGYSEGQVKGLLERARELLRQRLARRGFEFGAVLLAATVMNAAGAAPSVATEVAVRVATGQGIAGGASSAAVALSERVVGAMFVQKLKTVAVVLVVAAVTAGGAFTHGAAEGTEPGKGKVEPGHAFAPKGGRAITDDPLMPPSKPVPPVEYDPRLPKVPEEIDPYMPPRVPGKLPRDPKIDPFAPPRANPLPEIKRPPTLPKGPLTADKLDPKMLRELGNRFDVEVTGRTDGHIAGTEVYLYDSDLNTAAVHAGLVKVGEKAVITVTVVKCPKSGIGTARNGVKSLPWDDAKPTDTALVLQRIPKEDRPAVNEKDGLTIDQAILAKDGERVTVKFEIGSSQHAWSTALGTNLGKTRVITFYPKTQLKDGGKFQVIVTGKAATCLFNLGLMDEPPVASSFASAYFQGKTVRVTGKVEPMEEPAKKGSDYRLVILDLENLEVVK